MNFLLRFLEGHKTKQFRKNQGCHQLKLTFKSINWTKEQPAKNGNTGTPQVQQMANKDEGQDLSGVTKKHKDDEITCKQQTAHEFKKNFSALSRSNQK